MARFESVPAVRERLHDVHYLADEGIAGVVYLADRLQKPILVEGPAGTLLLYSLTTFHRGAAFVDTKGARFNHHFCYKRARTPWTNWTAFTPVSPPLRRSTMHSRPSSP